MASVHCMPIRGRRAAAFNPLCKTDKLCFCTEELGSESTSNSITTSGSAVSMAANAQARPRVLHGSLQEASAHENFNGSNSGCTLQQGFKEAHVGIEEEGLIMAYTDHSQCANLSVQNKKTKGLVEAPTRVRTFPPPIASLLSDRPILRTCKFNGRFVLQRMNTVGSSPFSVIRENGRLRLIPTSNSSASCGLMDSNGQHHCSIRSSNTEDGHEEEKHTESTHTILGEGTRPPFDYKQSAESTPIAHNAIESSVCVPRSMKPFGHPLAMAHKCLPTLKLLLLVAQNLNKMDSTGFTNCGIGKRKPKCKGRLYSDHHMQDKLLLNGTQLVSNFGLVLGSTYMSSNSTRLSMDGIHIMSFCNIPSWAGTQSSLNQLRNSSFSYPHSLLLDGIQLGNSYSELGSTHVSCSSSFQYEEASPQVNIDHKRKAALGTSKLKSKSKAKMKPAYAIISMEFGLIILLLEISSMGTLAKSIYLYRYNAKASSGSLANPAPFLL